MGISAGISAWIGRLRSWRRPNARVKRRSFSRRRFQPRMELLEDRWLLSAGAINPIFGVNGSTAPDYDAAAKAIVVEGDGKIVVLDQAQAGLYTAQVPTGYDILRYNTDGTLDPTFGNQGRVTANFGAGTSVFNLAVLSDGQIVVGGDHVSNQIEFLDIARFNSDGTPDTTFGSGGIAEFDVGTDANSIVNVAPADMAVLADGDVAVVGTSPSAVTLVCVNPSGALDTTFGNGGIVTTALASDAQATGIAVQGDGKIVVSGYDNGALALLRYNTDGSLDTTFGAAGIDSTALPGTMLSGSQVAIDPNTDQLVVSADSYTATDSGDGWSYGQEYFTLLRFNSDGSPDQGFGTAGQVSRATTFFITPPAGTVENLALQDDGKILVASSDANAYCRGDPL